jgi:hypothetical protein
MSLDDYPKAMTRKFLQLIDCTRVPDLANVAHCQNTQNRKRQGQSIKSGTNTSSGLINPNFTLSNRKFF